MFPINVSLFAYLGKHCCGNKICFPGSKNVSQQFTNTFVAETKFRSLPICFQMFPARETLFSRLGMLKQYFKIRAS